MGRTPGLGASTTSDDRSIQLPLIPGDWTVTEVDRNTGARLGAAELVYRRRIAAEAANDGAFGVDNRYAEARADIHQSLINEQGQLAPEGWALERARTTIIVPIDNIDDPKAVRDAAVEIARAALGPFAGEVMLHLYAISNDPPNWRNPAFVISISDLLDRLGYKRDAQGRHYTSSRRHISTTLMALHFTHVGLRHEDGQRQQGLVAPLLDTMSYDAGEEARHLGILDVFAQGLPDRVGVRIHQLWYDGLRTAEGHPGLDYTLIPRLPARPIRRPGPQPGRSTPHLVLREYLASCEQDLGSKPLVLARNRLLEIAGIHAARAHTANRTLARSLQALADAGLIASYSPIPLPTHPDAPITISWPAGTSPTIANGADYFEHIDDDSNDHCVNPAARSFDFELDDRTRQGSDATPDLC